MEGLIAVIALCLSALTAFAGPLEDGVAAYKRGDFDAALRAWRPLAERGVVDAEFNLGSMYYVGLNVPRDYAEALRWYRRAADRGNDAKAQINIGYMYAEGDGASQDRNEALRWYRRAADQGVAQGQFKVGQAYEFGEGVAQDYDEARKWYRLAADQGYRGAMMSLGSLYDGRHGVPRNDQEAWKWFKRARAETAYFPSVYLGEVFPDPVEASHEAKKESTSMWDKFIVGFCKVEFLCYQGDPNWLGYIVLGIGGFVAAVAALIALNASSRA